MIVDLFAGPGGWDEGLRLLGVDDVVGLEWDDDACATAVAAGHKRDQIDVAATDPAGYAGASGLIASPPCQAFSQAGKGLGNAVADQLIAHVLGCLDGWVEPAAAICADDVRADLTLQPIRWVDALRPEWVACEQVRGVAPLWDATAEVLRGWGYQTATAVVNAANYGVPQTRQRAVLLASRVGPVRIPAATHFDGRKGTPMWGKPWVTMADGIKWGFRDRPAPTVCAGPGGKQTGAEWGGSAIRQRMYDAHDMPEWAHKRPATTVMGDPRIFPGPRRTRNPEYLAGGPPQSQGHPGAETIRVSVEEAGVLQSFRPDYPWQGSKTKRYEQVGNAVPPLLAAAVLRQFVDADTGVAA